MAAILAIAPIFGLIVLGYLLGWRQWLSADSAGGLSQITFKLFMPCLLFVGIAKAPLGDALSPVLLLVYFVPALLVFALINIFAHRASGGPTAFGLAGSYSNNVLVGIPMITALFGHDGLVYLFALLAVHSLILFSIQSSYAALGLGSKQRPGLKMLFKNLANPLVIGLLLGVAVNVSDLPLPSTLWQMLEWLSRAALPCALIVLGIGLTRHRLRSSPVIWSLCLLKLIAFPLIVWGLSTLVPGLSPLARHVLVLAAANPIGVNVLAFAMTPEQQRTIGGSIFLSTLLAAFTLPLWMMVMSQD
ncbi:AEC family transporter [Phytohalomonas tamaricis]|uniref:AEC family transporter n=1 Tax=Phytohalomonas tamaricis TaxID=2081032 RepID=UPI000D0AD99F|nr:AEC family transporter [Phytohalomonas tamaricis]